MSDQDRQAMSDEERREAAKMDAQILAQADVIRQDSERLQLAQYMASEMALENAELSKAFSDIASSSLRYPKMEQERAETQNVGPSSGI
jgi:hypothetical protein